MRPGRLVIVVLIALSIAAGAYALPWYATKAIKARVSRGGGGVRGSGAGTISGSPPPPATGAIGCTFSATGPVLPCTFGG